MPTRKARPRARPRALEGLERLNAQIWLDAGPVWLSEEAHRARQLRRFAEWWAELRAEVIAADDGTSWAVAVYERGENPPSPSRVWIEDPSRTDADRLAFADHASAEGRQLADEARAVASGREPR